MRKTVKERRENHARCVHCGQGDRPIFGSHEEDVVGHQVFQQDVDQLEDTLYALNKNKYSLKLDASKAKAELKAAEKQFDLTHSAADGLKKELAQANYDNIVRNMKAVTTAARDTEKAISKVENRPGGSSGAKK